MIGQDLQQKISNVLAKKFDYKTTKTAKEGTAYHKVMELISFDCHTIADVEAEIDNMVENNQLSEEQRKLVKASDIFECLQNPLMKLVDKNTVRQEQQFKILIPAKEVLLDTTIEDKVMVQGVIDMFIPKTDRNPNILIDETDVIKPSGKAFEGLTIISDV